MDEQKLFDDIQAILTLRYADKKTKDTGTCNMDAPAIRIQNLTERQMREIVERAGGYTRKWEFMGANVFVIDFNCPYQGILRTQIAIDMVAEFKKRGYDAMLYCETD